ncbi:hypothetical protein [Epilithonimonas sp.]|uniref:hypothetical protein n=1 Tax=Epilithonimonas sp. TaxID=2894511 RepID=UPI002896E708|nr:hypothetical protein [Epilithonimonas sp.]
MNTDYIDKFFDNISDDVLKEKWTKYDFYSQMENKVKISELLEAWNHHYENTFSLDDAENEIIPNVNIDKSEQSFGLFYYL